MFFLSSSCQRKYETFEVININYTINSTNIDRTKKPEGQQTKSLNQSTINQNINPLCRPGT